jgi:hypothetical protein
VGFAGADDFVYIDYAIHGNGLPDSHWECRWPFILALRLSFGLFGFSEFAACLPSLLSSAAILVAVAFAVNWPRNQCLASFLAVLLASSLPIDVVFSSIPGATTVAAGIGLLGTVLMIQQRLWVQVAGASLLAVSFAMHEMSFFWVAIFCLTFLAFSFRTARFPVAVCVVSSLLLLAGECLYYNSVADDPFLRWHITAAAGSNPTFTDSRVAHGQIGFFLWPLHIMVFDKQWGLLLGVAILGGVCRWTSLIKSHRIILISGIIFWFWLGYGSIVPWEYRPRSRGFHYYLPLVLVISVISPQIVLAGKRHRAKLAILIIALNLLLVSAGGSWGQRIDVSRELLSHIRSNSDLLFLVDEYTYHELKFLSNSFPVDNVIKASVLGMSSRVDFVVEHYERPDHPMSAEYLDLVHRLRGREAFRVAPRFRRLLVPFSRWLPKRSAFMRSKGAVVYDTHVE